MGRKFEKLNKQHSQCSMNSGQFLVLQKQGDYSKISNFRPFTLQRELGWGITTTAQSMDWGEDDQSESPEKDEGATDKQSPASSTLSLWLATTLCNLSNIRSDLGLDPDQLENC